MSLVETDGPAIGLLFCESETEAAADCLAEGRSSSAVHIRLGTSIAGIFDGERTAHAELDEPRDEAEEPLAQFRLEIVELGAALFPGGAIVPGGGVSLYGQSAAGFSSARFFRACRKGCSGEIRGPPLCS